MSESDQANMKSKDSNCPLRVLHVVGRMNATGAETRLMDMFRNIDREKFRFDFCTLVEGRGFYDSEIASLGGRVLPCHLRRNIFSFLWRFYRLLKKNRFDIVHSHVLTFSGICLTVAKWAGVKKRIAHLRSTSSGKKASFLRHIYHWLTIKLMLHNATNIIGISKHVLRTWFGDNWQDNAKTALVYNGIDTTAYHCKSEPGWLKSEFGIPAEYKTVVHVGRFAPPKNHTKIAEIAAAYLHNCNDTCFILVGDGALRKEIEDLVKLKHLDDKFRFAGARSDVPRILRSADAFLFPSLWEGLGGAVIEAVAAGLSMVVSDLPAIREILDICGSAELLSVDSPDGEWAAALKRALNTPKQSQWLDSVESSPFSVPNAWLRLKEIYEK